MKILLTLILLSNFSLSIAQQFTEFAPVQTPGGMAFSEDGTLYVTSQDLNKIYKITPSGDTSTFVSGLSAPERILFDIDGSGNLFVTDYLSGSLKKITPAGNVTTFASGFSSPFGLAQDSSGNFYVGNFGTNNISKVTSNGTVSTFATGFTRLLGLTFYNSHIYACSEGGSAVYKVSVPGGVVSVFLPSIPNPRSITFVRSTGYAFVTDHYNDIVRRVSPDGTVSIFSDVFFRPTEVKFDQSNHMYVANFIDRTIVKSTEPVGINQTGYFIANQFSLEQNYPNPFNPITHLEFGISDLPARPGGGFVSLKVYDALGKEVSTLVNEVKVPGNYTVQFDGSNLSSGIYFYRLQTGDIAFVKSMVLMK